MGRFPIRLRTRSVTLEKWIGKAEACWRSKTRPADEVIYDCYNGIDKDIGDSLVNLKDFALDPSMARILSGVFFARYSFVADYFLLVFLQANLIDRMSADVSVSLAAKHIRGYKGSDLCVRFNRCEIELMIEYFRMIRSDRGFLLDEERAALAALQM